MGLRDWMRRTFGAKEELGGHPDDPVEIGYVDGLVAEIYVTRLAEDGFRAHAIHDSRGSPMGHVPFVPKARIFAPRAQADSAAARLDEMVTATGDDLPDPLPAAEPTPGPT